MKIKARVAALLAAIVVGVSAVTIPVTVSAAPAYQSKWTEKVAMEDLLLPALTNQYTDANGVYRQLRQGLRFGTIYQGNILHLYQRGAKIPAESLRLLAKDGLISGYLYKFITQQPFEMGDFSDVFDPMYYYGYNPDLMASGIPYDPNTLFQHFLTQGMTQGRTASANFNLEIFKANYPDLVQLFGNNNENYYLYYILYGRENGQIANNRTK